MKDKTQELILRQTTLQSYFILEIVKNLKIKKDKKMFNIFEMLTFSSFEFLAQEYPDTEWMQNLLDSVGAQSDK